MLVLQVTVFTLGCIMELTVHYFIVGMGLYLMGELVLGNK